MDENRTPDSHNNSNEQEKSKENAQNQTEKQETAANQAISDTPTKNETKPHGASIYYAPHREKKLRSRRKRIFALTFFFLLSAVILCMLSSYLIADYLLSRDENDSILVYHRVTEPAIQAGTPAEVYASVADAVVEVRVSASIPTANGGESTLSGAGSGVIFSRDKGKSYIFTNHHVVDGFSDITVRLSDGTELEAKLIGSDWMTDIAVLSVSKTDLPLAVLGDSSTLIPGQAVVAIGNPLGTLGGSITSGIISGPIERQVEIGGISMSLIQSSTPVSPGNSGGGLFNMYGELVGIVNAKYASESVEGISFSIPMKSATAAAEELISQGYVSGRADLGLTFTRTLYGQTNGTNLYYLYVETNAHHDDALGENQILKGDRISHIDGIAVSDITDIRSALTSKKTDGTDSAEVTVVRTVKEQFGPFGSYTREYSYTFTVPCSEYKGETVLVNASDIKFY